MMLNDRHQLRQIFIEAWQKHQKQQTLVALEAEIVSLIELHPEYQDFMNSECLTKNFRTDNNPFLHLGLHLSLREQINHDRPKGIKATFTQLMTKHSDPHHIEHSMMEIMGEVLWEAQQNNTLPDERHYLEKLLALL